MNSYRFVRNSPTNVVDPLGLRPLTDCEKETLSPYIPEEDLENADLHDGEVPWWFVNKNYDAVTVNNDIYIRPGVYDPSTSDGIGLLGHELYHVGQYRRGEMTVPSYLWEAIKKRSGGRENKFEKPAYDKQDEIIEGLGGSGAPCECRKP